ncbi:hypothetical protein [Streptomyces sp. NPDC101455]|uniref:hypothetical protein n=1 Tax=Streptomyces sp. NPDC101455 TaxID=3366142 RepID=UPI00381B6B77
MACVNVSRAARTSPAFPCAAASAPPIEWRASSDVPEGISSAKPLDSREQAAAGHAHLAGSYAESAVTTTDPVALRDGKFAYGLDVVLDGLSLRLAR